MYYIIRNNGADRDFYPNERRYYMRSGTEKRTDNRDFAIAMKAMRHVQVWCIDRLDKIVKIGELRRIAKEWSVSLERTDKIADIRAKIRAAASI